MSDDLFDSGPSDSAPATETIAAPTSASVSADAWENQPLGSSSETDNSADVSIPADQQQAPVTDANARGAKPDAQPPQPTGPAKNGMLPEDLRLAKGMGYSDADIELFASRDQFLAQIAALGNRFNPSTQAASQAQNAGQQQVPQQQQAAPVQQQQQVKSSPYLAPLDLDGWDPDVSKTMTGLNQHVASKFLEHHNVIGQMANEVIEMRNLLNNLLAERGVQQIASIAQSIPEYKSIIGDKSIYAMTADDPARKILEDARLHAMFIAQNIARSTGTVPDPEHLTRVVFEARFKDQLAAARKASIHADIRRSEQRLSGNVAGPGSGRKSNGTEISGRAGAVALAKEIMER